jgi:hypothetical protein
MFQDLYDASRPRKISEAQKKTVGGYGIGAPLRKGRLEQSFLIPAPCEKAAIEK